MERRGNIGKIISGFENDFLVLVSKNLKMLHSIAPLLHGELQVNFENFITKANGLDMAITTLKGKEESKLPYLKEGTLFKRADGRWEAKLMIDGKQISIACCKRQKDAHQKLKEAIDEKTKTTKGKVDKASTLHSWLDHWHALYRMPKHENNELSQNTIIMDLSMIRRIKREFKDIKLKDLKADYIQEKLAAMTQRRTAEGMYTVLKLALLKAKDRTGGRNIMENVEMIKHRRVGGRALTRDEIDTLISAADNETEKDIIRVYVNTGCRVDELTRIFVGHINLSNESRMIRDLKFHGKSVADMELRPNEIFIYGTKTRLSIRTMPITPKLKPILERLIADRDSDEQLFPKYHCHTIRNFHKEINARLVEKGTPIKYTLKDYRHTAATNFKDAGIPSNVYYSWFGWSDDTMAKRVYTHKTEYESQQSQEWASKFM